MFINRRVPTHAKLWSLTPVHRTPLLFESILAEYPLKAMLDLVVRPTKALRAFLFRQGYLELAPFDAKGVEYDGAVDLRRIFAPLGLGKEQVSASPGARPTGAVRVAWHPLTPASRPNL